MILPVNNNQPSFCKYSIIQIPKGAFVSSADYLTVEKELTKLSKKAGEEKNILKKITNFIMGRKNHPNFESFLEQPFFANVMNYLEKNRNCSLEWLNLHTGVKTKPPIKKDYYSYVLLTGQDADILSEVAFDSDSLQFKKENVVSKLVKHLHDGRHLDSITITAHLNHEFNEDFEVLFYNVTPDIYEVNGPKEFLKTVKKIFSEKE